MMEVADEDRVVGVVEMGVTRQDVLVPVKTKKGAVVRETCSVGMLATKTYHPSETLTGLQKNEEDDGVRFVASVRFIAEGVIGMERSVLRVVEVVGGGSLCDIPTLVT